MAWPGQPERDLRRTAPQPSINVALLAPNPRQFKRGSCGFWRLTAVSGRRAPAAANPLNPAQRCGKRLRQAKDPGAGKGCDFLDGWISRPPHSTALPPFQGVLDEVSTRCYDGKRGRGSDTGRLRVSPRGDPRLYTGGSTSRRGGRVAEGTRLLSEYGDQTPSRVRIPPSPSPQKQLEQAVSGESHGRRPSGSEPALSAVWKRFGSNPDVDKLGGRAQAPGRGAHRPLLPAPRRQNHTPSQCSCTRPS